MSILKMSSPMYYPSIWDEMFRDQPKTNVRRFPAVNVIENEESFILQVVAPGLKRELIDVNIDQARLTISSESERSEEGYLKKEYSFAKFSRSFTLPESVDQEQISAKYEDGVLEMTLPKREEAKVKPARKVEVA